MLPSEIAAVAVLVLVLGLVTLLFARGWTTTLVIFALVIVGVEAVRSVVRRESRVTDPGFN